MKNPENARTDLATGLLANDPFDQLTLDDLISHSLVSLISLFRQVLSLEVEIQTKIVVNLKKRK